MQDSDRFSSLKNRDFRLFWFGQIVSFSGTWMHSTAQGWLVYSLTRSPFYLGMVSAAASLPILLFTVLGGAVADRFRKRNLLLITQGLSIIPALAIALLTGAGAITVWQIMLFAVMLGAINAFDVPARQSFLTDIVQRGQLLNAIALNSAAFNGSRLLGPVIAGVIIEAMGVPACFYINAISFLAVILALFLIKIQPETAPRKTNIFKDITEGFRYIKGEPDVFRIMLLIAVFSLFGLPFVSMLPVFAVDVLNSGAKGLGFLMGASGIGALASALTIAYRGDITDKHKLIIAASIMFSVSLILFSYSSSYPLSLALMAISGLLVVAFLATANSFIQLNSPDRLRGRVMGVYTLLFLGMAPIGNTIMGILADYAGAPLALRIEAGLCLAASAMISMTWKAR